MANVSIEEKTHATEDKAVVDYLLGVFQSEAAWVQGTVAVDAKGHNVSVSSPDVCKVCLTGGLNRLSASRSQFDRIVRTVNKFLPGKHSSAIGFNDDKKTNIHDVRSLLSAVSTHYKHINGS